MKRPSTMSLPRRRTSTNQDATRRDHYQEVTDKIVEALESGMIPLAPSLEPEPRWR